MTNDTSKELKETIQSISKKAIKLIPYFTILSGIMIWSYLNTIGRLDLLVDTVSININLIFLLISIIIISISICIILTLPSYILILHYPIITDVNKRSIPIPWISLSFSILFLILIFTPHLPYIEIILPKLSIPYIALIIAILSFILSLRTSFRNEDFKKNSICDKVKNIGKIFPEAYTIALATLSISIPISILLKNSTGEKPISLIIALVFMIAFALSSFLPAIIYYRDLKNTQENDKNANIIPFIKNLSVAAIMAITITLFLFPNILTTLKNSTLYSIGLIDNKNHHFLINGEKYHPEMFPQHLWKTSTTDKIEKNFFIYGIRMFSAGGKNLICPDSVGQLKKSIDGTNYDLITSSDTDDNAKKLKNMTNICVVLNSDDAKQWDTFFEPDTFNK